MDEQVIVYLTDRIRASYRHITKNMAPNDEDDCVQECLASYFEKGRGQTIDQAVIDYLRGESGRKGSASYEDRRSLKTVREFDENRSYDQSMDATAVDLSLIQGRAREVFKFYVEGYTESEIGENLGISESRVSQILREGIAQYQVMSMVPKKLRGWVLENAFKRRNASFR